jgi:hypothetical protein
MLFIHPDLHAMGPDVRMRAECGISHKSAKYAELIQYKRISHEVYGSVLNSRINWQ